MFTCASCYVEKEREMESVTCCIMFKTSSSEADISHQILTGKGKQGCVTEHG